MKKQIFLTMLFVFSLTAITVELVYEQFLFIGNRGAVNQTIDDILAFYRNVTVNWVTLVWYSISVLLAWFGMNKIRKWNGGWIKWVTSTGLLAFCLTPGVFVNPDQANS